MNEIPVNVSKELSDKLDSKAQECGEDLNWVIEKGLEFIANLDLSILNRMRYYADGLDIPLWMAIQNLLISDWAQKAAATKVSGPPKTMPEFRKEVFPDGTIKVITGEDLFDYLFDKYAYEKWVEEERRHPKGAPKLSPNVKPATHLNPDNQNQEEQ